MYYDLLIQSKLLSFYGWWQFAVCLFAFTGLMAIWWHIGRRQRDIGQVWLALSVLCWSFSGLAEIWYADQLFQFWEKAGLPSEMQVDENHTGLTIAAWRSILSLLNSLFILLALPWFRYVPAPIASIIKSKHWYLIVGLPFLFSLLPTISSIINGERGYFGNEFDVLYAFLTLLFLGYVLWSSFSHRRLPILAGLSVVCILITSIAQISKFGYSDLDQTLFSAIFKTALIMLFFALALSWVKELSENIIPETHLLKLKLLTEKLNGGKLIRSVRLTGLPGKEPTDITLSPAHYELLHNFAQRRQAEGLEGGWLEIKPKQDSRSGKIYDINDHNQFKRLLHSLLDGLFGKGNWSRELHQIPLRNALFEQPDKPGRRIRLKLLPKQIEL